MVGLLPSRSLKRAENSLVASFWSTSKAVVSTRPWAVSRPSEATSVERSEEHTSELQSLMRISYAVFCLKKKNNIIQQTQYTHTDIIEIDIHHTCVYTLIH